MPEKNKTIFTLPSPKEMLFTRLFDAPPSLLFQVWTDPTHLAKWWGPSGFTTSDISMDLKPGGIWRLIMHGPDGTDYKNRQIFLEVEKPKRLVYKHVPEEGDEISHHQTTITFDEVGGGKQTSLTMRMLFPSQDERDRIIKKYGADKGGVQTLNRLGEYLLIQDARNSTMTDKQSDDREFVITRTFDAPPDLVFNAWTDPKHIANWWGPHGMTNLVSEMDVRPGGAYRLVMRDASGTDYPLKGIFRDVIKSRLLVMLMDFSEHSDAWHDRVNPDRDKTKPKPPLNWITTVTFEPLDNKTKLTIQVLFESAALSINMLKTGMTVGWSQTLERLATELERTAPKPHPTYANGKICYIEIPAVDIDRSAAFYQTVFGWQTRKRGDGRLAFDDTVGQVSGTWITGRKPVADPGLLVYIMVDNAVATIDLITANGGKITQPIGKDAPEITARFTDPAGNLFGIYQQPKQS
jgi:uncharacterized protein YndB with AHSA1/START domain/predicted enzyme related to lactoylglutathione lyase